MKPIILFESFPNFTGNSLALYNEFVKLGYDKIYDLRWAVETSFNEQTDYNVIKFFGLKLSARNKILDILFSLHSFFNLYLFINILLCKNMI